MRRLAFLVLATTGFTCAEISTDKTAYEVGDEIQLIISKRTSEYMALSGDTSCHSHIYVRGPGAWHQPRGVAFQAGCLHIIQNPDGSRVLYQSFTAIPPKGQAIVGFPTRFISVTDDPNLDSVPAILRIAHEVFTACDRPSREGNRIHCRDAQTLTSDPVVVFRPGTIDVVAD
jgi:hypothetical protein